MSMVLNSKAIKRIEQIVNSFNARDNIYFENLIPSLLPERYPAVYSIFDKHNNESLYVGRTKDLRRRLYTNHLMGNKSTARLKKYIVEDNDKFPNITSFAEAKQWIKNNCYFKYIEVTDSKDRGHIEGLLGFILNSYYIEDEH